MEGLIAVLFVVVVALLLWVFKVTYDKEKIAVEKMDCQRENAGLNDKINELQDEARAAYTELIVAKNELERYKSSGKMVAKPADQAATTGVAMAGEVNQCTQKNGVRDESEKEYILFSRIVGEGEGLDEIQILSYEYEQYICLDDGAINHVTGNGGKDIDFEPEPKNEYDPNAIAIHLRGNKIGYVYKKGNMQSMIHDWIKKDWYYRGYINKIFFDDNKATYRIGFYTPLSRYESKEFSLTKTRTKSWDDVPRSEYLGYCDVGEVVNVEYDSESDSYHVCDDAYHEIGELGSGARRFIEDSDCEKCIGVLSDIDYDNARAKVIIYLIG